MPHAVTWVDRLRIERAVWTLDQRLYDLPRRSRIAKRREVRENLLTAAHDIGISDALKHLGNSRQLAAEYRTAEFGDQPRPAWLAAMAFFFTVQLVFTSLLTEAALAFGDGVTAVNPNATGTFTWSGIRYLQDTVTYTMVGGDVRFRGGAATPLAWAIFVVGTVLIGRLWRAIPLWRRRPAAAATTG